MEERASSREPRSTERRLHGGRRCASIDVLPRLPSSIRALLLVTLAAYAIGAAIEQLTASADLWWHLATGRYIVGHLAIPRRDVFSYTNEGVRWVNPEWLAEVVLYLVYRAGGGTALALMKIVVTGAFLGLAVWVAWRRSSSLGSSVASGIAAAILCQPFLDIRPELVFFLATMACMATIDTYRRGAAPTVLVLLPLTTLLWVNLHASFVYGLGLIGLFTATEVAAVLLRRRADPIRRRRTVWLACAAVAAVLVCVLNPEHVRALVFPFVIGSSESSVWRTRVVEWTPPVLFGKGGMDPPLLGYYVVAVVVTTFVTLAVAPRSLDPPHVLLVAVTATMAFRARRFVPLFALVAVPLLATNSAVLGAHVLPQHRERLVRHASEAAVAALCLVALVYLGTRVVPELRAIAAEGLFEHVIGATYFPRGGSEFLRMNSPPARIFHPYAWGGYLAFHVPDRKVFIDGRGHTVYPGEFYRENLTAEFGAPGWQDVLDRHGVDLVLWPAPAEAGARIPLLRQLAASKAWTRIYDDGHDTVFVHAERGRPWLEAYRSLRLAYPDIAGAKLFEALTYLDAGEFESARDKLQQLLRRFTDGGAVVRAGEQNMDAAARTGTRPIAYFALGFLRAAHGDEPGARDAYRAALTGGIGEPYAGYAQEALDSARPVRD